MIRNTLSVGALVLLAGVAGAQQPYPAAKPAPKSTGMPAAQVVKHEAKKDSVATKVAAHKASTAARKSARKAEKAAAKAEKAEKKTEQAEKKVEKKVERVEKVEKKLDAKTPVRKP